MNYRHAFHAGNFADAVKHVAFVAVIGALARKEAPFAVLDTHGGAGIYDLKARAAKRTGEAEGGIGRLKDIKSDGALGVYLDLVRNTGEKKYPGSPLIAARLLRPQDRLVTAEKQPDEAAILKDTLAQFRKARVIEGDGYKMLAASLPPAERRGVILIDPPFEAADEFEQMGNAFMAAYRRFATGIYLMWFPLKDTAAADQFAGEVLAAGVTKALRIDFAVTAKDASGKPRVSEFLSAAGLMVVNPPYGFAEEMEKVIGILSPLLGSDASGTRIEWVIGKE